MTHWTNIENIQFLLKFLFTKVEIKNLTSVILIVADHSNDFFFICPEGPRIPQIDIPNTFNLV